MDRISSSLRFSGTDCSSGCTFTAIYLTFSFPPVIMVWIYKIRSICVAVFFFFSFASNLPSVSPRFRFRPFVLCWLRLGLFLVLRSGLVLSTSCVGVGSCLPSAVPCMYLAFVLELFRVC